MANASDKRQTTERRRQTQRDNGTMVTFQATAAAFLSTSVISLAPNVILLLFPSYAAGEGGTSTFLSLGQAMAAGGLLGDVFLHTLHHATHSETAGVWILVGFTAFFMADLIIRSLDKHQHGHTHSSTPSHTGALTNAGSGEHANDKTLSRNHDNGSNSNNTGAEGIVMNRSVIMLNMVADALHNFTDGLAIGATFATHHHQTDSFVSLLSSRGGLASISIMFHEIPHEIGDFCTLVRAGYTKSQALVAQAVTAIAAFIGTAVALFLSSAAEGYMGDILLFTTAGGFIYLAATTILPEVLQDDSGSSGYRLSQLLAFIAGIGFLYLVALLEDEEGDDAHEHHHHHHAGDSPHRQEL